MRRLLPVLVLGVAAVVWPAASSAAHASVAPQAVGSLQADFNNDGFVDLAVGVPGEDVGNISGAGAVNVLYGSAGGLSGTGSRLFWQGAAGVAGTAEAFDHLGWALAAADFNNNGFVDLAVGVPGEDVRAIFDAGAVNVLYGSAGGLSGAGSQLFWQGAAGVASTAEGGDNFGSALAAADFNNNGFADLAVGVPFENVGAIFHAGAMNVLYGSAGGLTGAGSQLFRQGAGGVVGTAEAFDQFGFAVDAGDFNNNGVTDLAVGVPGESVGAIGAAGAVNVLYGSAGGLTGAGSQLFWQGAAGVAGTAEQVDFFGWAVAAGDFNNNGFADLAVGVRNESIGAIFGAGAVNVLYGSAGGLTGTGSQLFRQGAAGVAGTAEAEDNFGWAVSAGDFNNNGFVDLAVGVPNEDVGAISDAGAINVLYGAGGGLTTAGNQAFRQGAGGVAGTAEAFDNFGFALLGSDQPNVSAG